MKKILVLVIAVAIVGIVGCSEDKSAKPQAASEALPERLISPSQPAGALDIVAAKKSAKDGEAIVIRGHVGGTEKPLAENRALMTLADVSLPTCDKTPMDTCKTPWDSCCEPQEVRTAKSVSVEVVGADGKPLRATLQGVGGIAPLKQVVVSGTAKTAAGSDALVVIAKEIYVVP